jgi:hypothetical protein
MGGSSHPYGQLRGGQTTLNAKMGVAKTTPNCLGVAQPPSFGLGLGSTILN